MIHLINIIIILFLFAKTSSAATINCESNNLNRGELLLCEKDKATRITKSANHLYHVIKSKLTDKNQIVNLDIDRTAWLKKMDTECSLRALAFNGWGKQYARDSDFQYMGCKTAIAGRQLMLYKQLICPETLETAEEPECQDLVEATKVNRKSPR